MVALTKILERIEKGQPRAAEFIEQMATTLAVDSDPLVTEKQLEWLRRLAVDYLGDIPGMERKVSWKR